VSGPRAGNRAGSRTGRSAPGEGRETGRSGPRAPAPEALARLHAACFVIPRPWSAAEFAALLARPGARLISEPDGFALGHAQAGEGEILTLAVRPQARRRGIGRRLLSDLESALRTAGARQLFLEVAADNAAALALYASAGYRRAGRRRGYYRAPDGKRLDALLLQKALSRPP